MMTFHVFEGWIISVDKHLPVFNLFPLFSRAPQTLHYFLYPIDSLLSSKVYLQIMK